MVHHHRVVPLVVERDLAPEGRPDTVAQSLQPLFGQIPHLAAQRPHRSDHLHRRGDHVERMRRGLHRRHRHHKLLGRVGVPAGNRLNRRQQMRRHHRGVHRLVRLGGMSALALDQDLDLVGRRKERARPDRELPHRHAGPVMHAVDLLDAEPLHHPVVAHLLAAAAAFLGGLKDHRDRAIEIPRLRKVARRAQQHRRMPVMPAGMHRAGRFRGILDPRLLMNRQRIHVGPQPDHLAAVGLLPLDDPDDARAPQPGDHLVTAERLQLLGHQGTRPVRLEQYFGVFVDIPPPGGDLVMHLCKPVLHGHRSRSFFLNSRCRTPARHAPAPPLRKQTGPVRIPHREWVTGSA